MRLFLFQYQQEFLVLCGPYGLQCNASPPRYHHQQNPSYLAHQVMDIVWRNLELNQPWIDIPLGHHEDGIYQAHHPPHELICDMVCYKKNQADAWYIKYDDAPALNHHEYQVMHDSLQRTLRNQEKNLLTLFQLKLVAQACFCYL